MANRLAGFFGVLFFLPPQKQRREISRIVFQVLKITGGDKGNGGIAASDLGEVTDSGNRRAGTGGDPAKKNTGKVKGDAVASSRPELLIALKDNLENLGASRAALQRGSGSIDDGVCSKSSNSGGGHDREGCEISGVEIDDVVSAGRAVAATSKTGVEEKNGEGGPQRESTRVGSKSLHGENRRSPSLQTELRDRIGEIGVSRFPEVDASNKKLKGHGTSIKGVEDSDGAGATAAAGTVGADNTDADDSRLHLLHNMYSAKEEPSSLPLYPPGDAFLMCNASRDNRVASREGLGAKGATEYQEFISSMKGDEESKSRGDDATNSRKRPTTNDGDIVDQNLDGAAGAYRGNSTLEGVGSGERLSSRSAGVEAKARQGLGLGQATEEGQKIMRDNSNDLSGMVLVRVPHHHFLRITLSPTMIKDHNMSSYKRALAGLKEKSS